MAETTKARKTPAKPRKTASKAVPETETKPVSISKEAIAKLAHQFWAERGHKHGSPEEDWLRAERELRKRAS
jgi:hypothetical protein